MWFMGRRPRRRRYYGNVPLRRLRDLGLAVVGYYVRLAGEAAALDNADAELAAAVAVDAIAGRARRGVALAAEAAREVVAHFFLFGGLGVVCAWALPGRRIFAGRRGVGSRLHTGEAFLALPSRVLN